ncbi:MAG TPA: HDIG domain-containing metalloprotein [Humisphaera sp.]|nr:HDIG domain-containing metalloprotein [Humisphaera sp.]
MAWIDWEKWQEHGVPLSVGIACAFFIVASGILMFRQDVVPYRPGQWLNHDIVSRVNFHYNDPARLDEKQKEARARAPRVYQANGDVWREVEDKLDQLPDLVAGQAGPSAELQKYFDSGAVTALRRSAAAANRDDYIRHVADYVDFLRQYRVQIGGKSFPITVLPEFERAQETRLRKPVTLSDLGVMDSTRTFSIRSPELRDILATSSRVQFLLALQPAMVQYTLAILQPTHALDEAATTVAADRAADEVNPREGDVFYAENQVLVYKSRHDGRALDKPSWNILRAEHHEYLKSLRGSRWVSRVGVGGVVLAITFVLCCYITFYEPRILRNHTRQTAIAALLLSMLLLNQIAAIGDGPIYLFGLAPTLLVAMIITIAYDQRSAMGIASMHALLATIALNQNVTFFVVLWVGVLTVCFLLDDIRTRSKLIEVGGATALAMAGVTAAAGLLAFDPWEVIRQNCLYAGAAGLGVGFVVLGILPFIEKAFKITTSMTLLEMADISQPLLRRLQLEAPGTYSHSLQVAALSEAAAEAIGANSLLCRVASYYHDVGKINKADYFCENQSDGENRHLNLSPSVSLLIIIGHVKDGVELAREYNLPSSIIPFIQQHHGTTLVRYFFHQAKTQQEQQQPDMPAVCDTQYRYPGPKPKTREVAIVMLADAIESAARTMGEATPSRIESLIRDIAQNRLLDGQFDECDITMREIEQIERSLMKTLTGIYHGRVVYPSMNPERTEPAPATTAAVRSA